MSYFYDLVLARELNEAHELEKQGFPADEAASLEQFQYRQAQAPELFLGLYEPKPAPDNGRHILGYVCSTLSPGEKLDHHSMSHHVPGGRTLCIHSVCVHPEYKGKGHGTRLVKEYLRRAEASGLYDRILLLAHDELRGFYEGAGLVYGGPSEVEHGAGTWLEMRYDFKPTATSSDDASQQSEMPPGLWQALQASSAKERPTPMPSHQAQEDISFAEQDGSIRNRYDVLCPRPGCSSLILKKGVAKLVERSSVEIDPPLAQGRHPLLAALPSAPETTSWWLITPSPMEFENIGFSKPVSQSAEIPALKLLICAECDLGPLGWCEQGGKEFWLARQRVSYRQQ